jgi:hypothetical protein
VIDDWDRRKYCNDKDSNRKEFRHLAPESSIGEDYPGATVAAPGRDYFALNVKSALAAAPPATVTFAV